MELLELAQVAPTLIHRRIVVVRLLVEVAPAHQAESFAIGSAERRERYRQDELLAKERREVDLEVAADPLCVGRRGLLRITAYHSDRGAVLLGEVRLHRLFDRPQAAAALLGVGRLPVALALAAGIRLARQILALC